VGDDASHTNQIGVAPGAKFIACRNMDQGNGTPASYLECMEWFLAPYPVGGTTSDGDVTKAPDVTTNSWDCPASEGCVPTTLQSAVEAQRAAGIMFVASATNGGPNCSTIATAPDIYDATYSVGAYWAVDGNLASFSSRGPVTVDGSNRIKPDITAPGVQVRSSITGSAYTSMSGTSMASPHVAGAIALLWSAKPSLKHQIAMTENILDSNAVPVSSTLCSSGGVPNNLFGWGRLDVKAAVDFALLDVEPGPSAAGLWLGPALPNPSRRSTLLRYRLPRAGETSLALFSSDGRRVRTLVRGVRPSGDNSAQWDGLDDRGSRTPAGLYFARLEAAGERVGAKLIWLGK
jgi:subtilisin family serine protease